MTFRKYDKSKITVKNILAKILMASKSVTSITQANSESSDSSSDDALVANAAPPKAKKRKTLISVCLKNCRYDVIKRTTSKFGYKEVTDAENWNLYWTDLSITIDRCKEMKRYQKINHFPGMLEICRKDLLARNLNRMLRLFPKDYNFFPRTWCFPADLGDALAYSKLRRNRTFILKPETGSQGRGIYVTKSLKDIKPSDRGVCQVYLNKPFLIDGYKFDCRVYALLTSCDPLRIFIYNEGLVRFATCKYKEPNPNNITNVFMHLTNYSVNKYSRTYNQDAEEGSKRKLTWLKEYLSNMGYDTTKVFNQIDDIIIKTLISASPILKHSYSACFPNHDKIPACSELLGIDVIFDKRANPILLEVNHSPSFHTDTALDCEIKESLLNDMFSMLNLEYCDKRRIIREDKRRVRERLLHGLNKEVQQPHANEAVCFDSYYKYELEHSGGFRLVYPRPSTRNSYAKFFDQGQNSLYSETASSRAREAAQNAMRYEMQVKAKLEAAKIVKKIETAQKVINKFPPHHIHYNNTFEPQAIVESEEKERLQKLAQRDYLIRSHGVLELIYFAMKKNGHLRPQDERKFAFFDKLRDVKEKMFGKKDGVTISDLVESFATKNTEGKGCGDMKSNNHFGYQINK